MALAVQQQAGPKAAPATWYRVLGVRMDAVQIPEVGCWDG